MDALRLILRTKRASWILAPAVLLESLFLRPHGHPNYFLMGMVVCWVLFKLYGYYWEIPKRVRKIYGQQKQLQEEMTVTLGENGIRVDTQSGNQTLPWSAVSKVKQDSRVILLFQTAGMFRVIPKLAFNRASDLEWFQGVLKSTCGKAAARKGVVESIPANAVSAMDEPVGYPMHAEEPEAAGEDGEGGRILAIHYRLEPEDLVANYFAKSRKSITIISAATGSIGVIGAILYFNFGMKSAEPLFIGGAAALLAVILTYRWRVPAQLRKVHRRNVELQGEIAFEISESGTRTTTKLGINEVGWDGYYGWSETPTLFRLIYSEAIGMGIPKRAFASEDDLQWFRGLLEKNVPRK